MKAPGPLALLSCILLLSAVTRIPLISSEALASGKTKDVASSETTDAPPVDENIDAILASLSERRKHIDQREEELNDREKRLINAEEEVKNRIQYMQKVEANLKEILEIAETAVENDVSALVQMYENMKPKNASMLFEQMNPKFAAGFLSKMRPEIAASILSGMKSENAYAISVVLAGRNVETSSQ